MEIKTDVDANNGTFTSEYIPFICYPTMISSSGMYNGDLPFNYSIPLLLFQVSFVTIVTSIIRFILKPLKQPSIVCNIIGGVLVGPSGFGRSKKFVDTIFPPTSMNVLNIGAFIGTIFHFFIIGLKQDTKLVVKSGRMERVISFVGIIIPFILYLAFYLMAKSLEFNVGEGLIFIIICITYSVAAFPSLHPILVELNLLNSKLGRLSISTSAINNVAGLVVVTLFGSMLLALSSPYRGLCQALSLITLLNIIVYVIRPMMFWIVYHTPEGKPVDRAYIIAICSGVFLISFISDLIGSSMYTICILLGLSIPDGPPLGATLVEKTETIIEWLFLPLIYASIGLHMDLFSIEDWTSGRTVYSIIIIGHMGRLVGTIWSSRYFKIPFYDALSLGLVLNFRGLVEIIILLDCKVHKMLDDQSYTILVLATVVEMAILTPLVSWFSRNTKLYTPYGQRNIEHLKPNTELRILTCIHSQENVPTMINLLEASNANRENHIRAVVVNLVELLGRATPILILHNLRRESSSSTMTHIKHINNAFYNYERYARWVSIQCYTTVSPYKTMHQDICMLALDMKVSMIVIPFHKRKSVESTMDVAKGQLLQTFNSNILIEAPCSVGILVDHGNQCKLLSRNSMYRICVLFIGGADDREALSYGFRMVGHSSIRLDVVRILSMDADENNEMESQPDDNLVAFFRIKYVGNERVVYKEEKVNSSEETIGIIRSISNQYNLIIVGRRQDNNSIIVKGLSQWCESLELGVIGDFLASPDFSNGLISVLVVQQQINSGLVVQHY